MADREKLVELLCQATFGVNKQTIESYLRPPAIAEVADHLLASGVVVLPCKVGDEMYCTMPNLPQFFPKRIIASTVKRFYVNIVGDRQIVSAENIGRTVFLTREEAEAAVQLLTNCHQLKKEGQE